MWMSSRRKLRSLRLVADFLLGLLGGRLTTLIGSLTLRGKFGRMKKMKVFLLFCRVVLFHLPFNLT
jgi:hypothetical protein